MDGRNLLDIAVIAVLGLIFGSFFNCTAMRIARHEDFVRGRSHCRCCGHLLGARDLIPLASWLSAKGRCRYCGMRLSVRYPLTELLAAAAAAGIYLRFGISAEAVRDWVLAGCLITLSLVDLESLRIPDGCLFIGFAAWLIAVPFLWKGWQALLSELLAGALCGGLMLCLSLVLDRLLKKESLGGGDIKLFALLGLYLGPWGAYFLIFFSSVTGLILAGLTRFAVRDKSRDDMPEGAIPLGPAIALAGYGLLLYGDAVTGWYRGWL